MVLLATASNPHFSVSRIEMERSGPSYTLDTVLEFRKCYGSQASLYWLTGLDAVLELLTWHEPERIIRHCRFIAASALATTRHSWQNACPNHSLPPSIC